MPNNPSQPKKAIFISLWYLPKWKPSILSNNHWLYPTCLIRKLGLAILLRGTQKAVDRTSKPGYISNNRIRKIYRYIYVCLEIIRTRLVLAWGGWLWDNSVSNRVPHYLISVWLLLVYPLEICCGYIHIHIK